MSRPYQKQLTFRSVDLGKKATLVLTFDQKVEGLFTHKFPVILKTAQQPIIGTATTTITYSDQLGFLKPEVSSGVIVDVVAHQTLGPSESTTLLENEPFSFTKPQPLAGGQGNYEVINGTFEKTDIAFGFAQENPNKPLQAVHYWNADAFQPSGSIKAQFSPVLRAYITNEYQDQQILRGPISAECIFEQDLSKLDDSTVWLLFYDPITGRFRITRGIF